MSGRKPKWRTSTRFGNAKASGNSRIIQIGTVKARTANIGLDARPPAREVEDAVAYYNVPSLLAGNFVDRPELHAQMKSALHDSVNAPGVDNQSKVLVVHGIGGAGKTQLVLRYLMQHAEDYAAVFWISLASKQAAEQDVTLVYRALCTTRREGEGYVPLKEMMNGIKAWIRRQKKACLWIVDNADNVEDEDHPEYVSLSTVMPSHGIVDVIVTTRSGTFGGISRLDPVRVDEMEEEQAMVVFWSAAKIDPLKASSENDSVARDIVAKMGRLALAVSMAGSAVSESRTMSRDLSVYLKRYEENRKGLLARRPNPLTSQYSESLLASWEVSFAAVKRRMPLAANLIGYLSLLDTQALSVGLFDAAFFCEDSELTNQLGWAWQTPLSEDLPRGGLDGINLERAFDLLSSFAFLRYDETTDEYSMHPVVQAWSYERLGCEEQLELERAASAMLLTIASGRGEAYTPEQRLELCKHIAETFKATTRSTAAASKPDQLDTPGILRFCMVWRAFAFFAIASGSHALSANLASHCKQHYEEMLGRDHEATIDVSVTIARARDRAGDLRNTTKMRKINVATARESLGKLHALTITAERDYAASLIRQGELDSATGFLSDVKHKWEEVLGRDNDHVKQLKQQLARARRANAILDSTTSHLSRVSLGSMSGTEQEEMKNSGGGGQGSAATIYAKLGDAWRMSSGDEIESSVSECIKLAKERFGERSEVCLHTMVDLGFVRLRQRRLRAALNLLLSLLPTIEEVLGEQHVVREQAGFALYDVATMLAPDNRIEDLQSDSENTLTGQEACEKAEKALGNEHPISQRFRRMVEGMEERKELGLFLRRVSDDSAARQERYALARDGYMMTSWLGSLNWAATRRFKALRIQETLYPTLEQ